ncbi:unnamed protein product, partial [Symbiodinium pilosum]
EPAPEVRSLLDDSIVSPQPSPRDTFSFYYDDLKPSSSEEETPTGSAPDSFCMVYNGESGDGTASVR